MANKGNIELLRARAQGSHGTMDPRGPPWGVMGANTVILPHTQGRAVGRFYAGKLT